MRRESEIRLNLHPLIQRKSLKFKDLRVDSRGLKNIKVINHLDLIRKESNHGFHSETVIIGKTGLED